jgi:hypothetical protein
VRAEEEDAEADDLDDDEEEEVDEDRWVRRRVDMALAKLQS